MFFGNTHYLNFTQNKYPNHTHRVRYYNLLTAGKLNSYLADVDQQAEKMFEELVKYLSEKERVTEKLKADSPMEWVVTKK